MEIRKLGKDLSVSAVGLGCMGFSHAYGAPTEQSKAIEMIRAAFDIGYTFFDTAEVYGTQDDPHQNEILVGEAIKPIRSKVQLASKFGIHFDMSSSQVNHPLIPDSRPETIRLSVEGSLKRLQTDYIDLYFQHRIDPAVEPETVAEVMADLIKEGKILHWGISEANEAYLRRAHAVCPVTAVENRYSMMARQYESLFPVLEEQENPAIQRQTAILNKNLYQLLRLAGNLTDMSRLIAGEMPMYDEKTELREFFGAIYDRVKPLCQAVGIEIKYACPTSKFYGVIDRQKMERAVLNLISNAMKYTPKGGKIMLRVETNKSSVLIKVADNGEGLQPELLATVFDRFSHRDPLGDPRWGMGLGLPYARYIAQLHGGTMIIEGKPGDGTSVTMSVSLHRQAAATSLRTPIINYDYAGGFEHCLVELADVLPSDVFDSMNVN